MFILLFCSLFLLLPARSSSLARAACSVTIDGYSGTGYADANGGACRYTVRYGTAERWGDAIIPTSISNQSFATLPPSCPQNAGTYVSSSTQSEDCLFATLYIPQSTAPSGGWPVFVWVHGGSFTAGSASAPGLDGASLAANGQMIVIVLQYRLGVLGFLPPTLASSSTDPNLGMKDVILALKWVNAGVGYVGGDKDKVTIGGQSSGASMIRAMWGAPSAAGLFRAAILQSDPMNYGFASTTITATLQRDFYAQSPFSDCTTLACLRNISTAENIAAQDTMVAEAIYLVSGIPYVEPIRPTYGVTSLPADPTTLLFNTPYGLTYQPANLPLLITTVKNEGGTAVQSIFPSAVPLSNATYYNTAAALVKSDRAAVLVNSTYYSLVAPASNTSGSSTAYGTDDDELRQVFERAVTDGIWRCANRDAATQWAGAGGKVWVGEWRQGTTYPDNEVSGGYCASSGRVCHEDDIYPTFGTAPNATSNASTFESEILSILSYWSSFIANLDPNSSSKRDCKVTSSSASTQISDRLTSFHTHTHTRATSWSQYTTQDDVEPLGGDGLVTLCPDGFWGEKVAYDWQLYG